MMKSDNVYRAAILEIPRGQTRTFMELAAMAGRPGAARAAGRALRALEGTKLPWHRVVSSDGRPRQRKASEPRRSRVSPELRRLRAEGARPKRGETVTAWASRVGAPFIGYYPSHEVARRLDERILQWNPEQVEPIFDEAQAIARGFDLPGESMRRTAALPNRPASAELPGSLASPIPERLAALDWSLLYEDLERLGYAHVKSFLSPSECRALLEVSSDAERFSRSVDMRPRGYGVGSYHYYREPLPEPARELRSQLYTRLVPLARELWPRRHYPDALETFWKQCRADGQRRSSSILICYERGGVNHAHRDIYGRLWFPFQALCMLSERGRDFEGGELFLMDEGGDGRVTDITVSAGDLAIFATRDRIEQGRRVPVRHGMRLLTRGRRYGIGIVFHLAE